MIKERSQVIPDQSVHLFTDWFRESLFSVTIIFVNATFPSAAVWRGEAELREAVLVVFNSCTLLFISYNSPKISTAADIIIIIIIIII